MRRVARGVLAVASVATVATLGAPLAAAPPSGAPLAAAPPSAPTAELDWQAPQGCPDRDRVLGEVAELVGTPSPEPLRARAVVTGGRDTFEVVIHLEGAATGARTLHAQSCESAARATALIIALAIDPQAAVRSDRRRDPQPAAPPASTPTYRDETATHRHPAKPLSSPRPVVSAAFLVERALLPGVAAGIEAAAGLEWPLLRADLALGLLPSASTTLGHRADVAGDFTLAFLALRGCVGALDAPLAVAGCAVLRGSRLWARGQGASPSFEQVAHVVSLEPGALLRFPGASALGTELGANLVLPLVRPRFVIEDGGGEQRQRELFRPAALGGAVKLGVGYRF